MLKVKAEKIEEEDVKPAISKAGGGDVVIGIDLGTTFSCVAVAINGNVEIIANDQGNRTTPSSVGFSSFNSDSLIGEAAKNQATFNPRRTVFDVNPMVQQDIKYLPYTVVNRDGKAYVELEVKIGEKVKAFSPEEISAMVLGKMKETTESYIGKPVHRVVVTVPAYFNDPQREATKNAGTIGGLGVLRIINEPTAAALAYGFHNQKNPLKRKRKRNTKSKILVYDLGGGTFDVSVLQVHGREFRVLAVGGDTHLGGGDFDRRVIEYFIGLIKRKYNGKDISGDCWALARLRKVVPAKMSQNYGTLVDQQTDMNIMVVQGERPLTKDCTELGKFVLSDIKPAPSLRKKTLCIIKIIDYKGYLTHAEIERMTREAKMMKEEDEIAKARVEAMNALEKYIYDVKKAIRTSAIGNMMSYDDKTLVESAIEEASLWLDLNKNATKEVYEEKMKKLADVWNSIITKVHNNS